MKYGGLCLIICVLMVAGCTAENKVAEQSEPNVPVFTQSTFALEAMRAAGSQQYWDNVQEIQLDSVVKIFSAQTNVYLTRHHYVISPWSKRIVVSGREAEGPFRWEYDSGHFDGRGRIWQLDRTGLSSEHYVRILKDIICAPIRLMETRPAFTISLDIQKVEGHWVYPIRSENASEVFYQNKDTGLVDMLSMQGQLKGSRFFIKGYDYYEYDQNGIYIPTVTFRRSAPL